MSDYLCICCYRVKVWTRCMGIGSVWNVKQIILPVARFVMIAKHQRTVETGTQQWTQENKMCDINS